MTLYDLREILAVIAILLPVAAYVYYIRRGKITRGDRVCLHWLTAFVAAFLAAVAFGPFFFTVQGHSMQPTYQSGERLYTIGFAPFRLFRSLRRGDVVTINYEGDTMVKRVYAVGGDRFWMLVSNDGGAVERQILPEQSVPALSRNIPHGMQLVHFTVDRDSVFVLGDNLSVSEDSRAYGEVPLKSVVGLVLGSKSDRAIDRPAAPD